MTEDLNNLENTEEVEEVVENQNNEIAVDFSTPDPSAGLPSDRVEQFTDNLSGNVLDTIDNLFQGDQKSKQEIINERQQKKINAQLGNEQLQKDLDESTDFFTVLARESVRAPLGGLEDAANSVLLTADKTGDELKKQVNQALGRPVDPTQDPSSDEYESWFDGNNRLIAENQTGIGRFGRDVAEFFVLTRWAGKALGPARTKASTMVGNTQLVRAVSPMVQSNRFLRWGSRNSQRILDIATDGIIAELIMSDSEGKNLVNMAEEHVPWLAPDFIAWLGADEDDTWYEKRVKSALVGSTANFIFPLGNGLRKASWWAGRKAIALKKKGIKTASKEFRQEIDKGFNRIFNKTLEEGVIKDQQLGDRLAQTRYEYGKGINPNNAKDEYIFKQLDIEDQAEYGRLLDGKEPSEWFVNNLKKRGKADLTEIEVADEDALWREAFSNLSDDDFMDVKGIMNMPQRVSLRELAMNDYFELAQKIGARNDDPWLPIQGQSLKQAAENILRESDPIVNPNNSTDFQRATYDGDIFKYEKVDGTYQVDIGELEQALKERQWNWQNELSLDTAFRTIDEPYISRAAAGNKDLYEIYKEVARDLDSISMGMKEADYKMSMEADIELARPFLEPIEKFIDGKDVDLVKEYKRILAALKKKGATDTTEYKFIRDPKDVTKSGRPRTRNIVAPGVSQMRANLFVLHTLGKFTSQLAKNTLQVNNNLPLTRNYEMFTDLMKVMFIENKKWGFNWGKQGQGAQGGIATLFDMMKKPPKQVLAEIQKEADDIFDNLSQLYKAGDMESVNDLLTISLLSNGQVTSLTQIPEYLSKYLRGGSMKDFSGRLKPIPPRMMDEMYQTVINSWLGHPKTAVNAVFMTNALNVSRGFEQWYANNLIPFRKYFSTKDGFKGKYNQDTFWEHMDYDSFKKTKNRMIGVQYSALIRSQKEAFQMFMRNFKINNKPVIFDQDGKAIFRNPDYGSRFDSQAGNAKHEELSRFYKKYGNFWQKKGKNVTDLFYNLNKLPIMKASRSVMNAGDAYTRTIIGRQQMAVEAAEEALKLGVDPDNLNDFVKQYDELFRKKIFRKNADDVWVVKDPRAKQIGDEVTLMKEFPNFMNSKKFLEGLQESPLTNRFFAFIRPAFNNAGNVADRTPLKMLRDQYQDIVVKKKDFEKWGISPEELPRAQDELIGRVALGTTLAGITYAYAMNGQVIGDYPKDEGERRMWKALKIQPNSFAIPKPWNPATQAKGDNGWIYVGFGRSDIAGTLFSFAGNLAYYNNRLGDAYFDQTVEKLSWLFAAGAADLGVVQGASDMIGLLDGSIDKGYNFERMGAKLFRPQLGAGGQSRFLAELFDNTSKEANTFLEYARQQDFIFKSNVPNDYDILGKTRGKNNVKPLRIGPHNPVLRLVNSLSPFTVTSTEGDFVKQALLDIRYDIGAEVNSLGGVQLNSQEKSDFKLVLAEDKQFRKELEQLVSSEKWKDNYEQYKELGKTDHAGWKRQQEWFYQEVQKRFTSAKERAVLALKERDDKGVYRFPEYNSNKPDSLFNRITVSDYQKEAAKISSPGLKKSLYNQIEKIRKYGTAPQ